MKDRVLTIPEIAAERIVPLSESSLYRAAREGDGPFYKLRGRWMAIESDLRAWVREGARQGNSRPRTDAGELLANMRNSRN